MKDIKMFIMSVFMASIISYDSKKDGLDVNCSNIVWMDLLYIHFLLLMGVTFTIPTTDYVDDTLNDRNQFPVEHEHENTYRLGNHKIMFINIADRYVYILHGHWLIMQRV